MDAVASLMAFVMSAAFLAVVTSAIYRWMTGWNTLLAHYRCGKEIGQFSNGSFRWVSGRFWETPLTLSVELYPGALWLRPSFAAGIFWPAL